jgi:tRNA (guanine-N7-)-methyltransferase
MGKNKLKRFEENLTFANMIQPKVDYPAADHELKGNWNKTFFQNNKPIVLELGCGRGEYTIGLAEKFPEKNFIGIDWKGARLWRGAKTAIEDQINNAGFLRIQILNICSFFAKDEVNEIWITFPDPQIEKSRERKRLTSLRFLNMYRKIMTTDGIVNLKTDSKPLYDFTLEVIGHDNLKVFRKSENIYKDFPGDEILGIQTTYEKMWLKDGSDILYLKFNVNPQNG